MKYHFLIYETFLGHRKVMAKRYTTEAQMVNIMKTFPGATCVMVSAPIYEIAQVGATW